MKKFLIFLFLNCVLKSMSQSAGDIAQSFGSFSASTSIRSIAIQADGKILVGGVFTTYNGVGTAYFMRLNVNGTKDSTFNVGFDSSVTSIAIQPDGKILVGGVFTAYNGTTANRIIRLNTDGTKDTTFNPGTGFNATVNTIAVQSDGKILIGGNFTSFNGATSNNYFIRLNSDGTKDTTFNMGGQGFSGDVRSIMIQSDGKILVGGSFQNYNAVSTNKFIRLNSDGTKDTTLNSGTGFSGTAINVFVSSIAIQTDGKILVGGNFTSFNGSTEKSIIRLNSDGTKDSIFNSGTGFNADVNSVVVQADGKILVGGGFTNYNGAIYNFYFIRLNSDGSKDTTFNSGIGVNSGFNAAVWSIAIQTNEKILIGGNFTVYATNNTSPYLIGLYSQTPLVSENFTALEPFLLYPNPIKDFLILSASNEAINAIKIYNLQGKLVLESTSTTIDVTSLNSGLYLAKVKTKKGETTKKFIKE